MNVEVTLDAEGAIASLKVNAAGETEGLGTKCGSEDFTSQFIGKKGPFALGNGIDAVTSATVTSTAVVEAINAAIAQ